MSYQPLHHKYRPQTFAELVGQPAIATTLAQAIATDKIAPAYLFAGPRGTGKTSSARIFAKSLNCLSAERPTPDPCGTCESCRAIAAGLSLDTIEIDAASNTGVDNIRELIERAQFAPVQCRYKLYLIDEVHMLSTAAFNALLKTLEEPPPRVVFVLATTDPQRVLPTIISRCQRFDFRRIPLPELTAHLQQIAELEGITLTPAAIAQVAQLANGGLRDAESLLDQLSLLPGEIGVEHVWDLVGAVAERDLLALVAAVRAGDAAATLQQCRQLLDRGREPLTVLQSLAGFLRDLLVAKVAPDKGELAALTPPVWAQLCTEAEHWERDRLLAAQKTLKESEGQIKTAAQPRLWLEVTLLTLGATPLPEPSPAKATSTPAVPRPAPAPQTNLTAPTVTSGEPQIEKTTATTEVSPPAKPAEPAPAEPPVATDPPAVPPAPVVAAPAPPTPTATPSAAGANLNLEPLWRQVADQLPPATRALVGQHCRLLALDGTVATVGVRNANLLRLAESKKANLETAFTTVCQQKTVVRLEVAPTAFTESVPAPKQSLTGPPPVDIVPPQPVTPVAAAPRTANPPSARKTKPTSSAKSTAPKSPPVEVPASLQDATSALAGDFNGEPIDLGDRDDWLAAPPPAPPATPPAVAESDDLEFSGDSEGEVPFARRPPVGDAWDTWEVAAQRPPRLRENFLA